MNSGEPGRRGDAEESFHAGQTRILEPVASGAPLPEILTKIVLLMEAQAEGMVCSILLLGADGEHVEHGAAPHLPETYVKAVNGAPIGPRNGSCGTAMYLKKQVVVTDVMTDPFGRITDTGADLRPARVLVYTDHFGAE